MTVPLFFYGGATGTFSSRKSKRATYDSVAFRFVAASPRPEHDTICDFRRRFLPQAQTFFEQIPLIAAESGMLKVGRVSIDGTKMKANASKHHALSYGHATKLERRIKGEIERSLRLAERADVSEIPDGMDVPEELARRDTCLQAIAQARERIRVREQERLASEQAERDLKMGERTARERETGKKPRGGKPVRPPRSMNQTAQVHLTDDDSRIMPSADGLVQAYDAQEAVDCDSRLLVAIEVSQRPTDRTPLEPIISRLSVLPASLGHVGEVLVDAGCYSETNGKACEWNNLPPYISIGRERHAGGLERRRESPGLPRFAMPNQQIQHQLRTKAGHNIYGQRKAIIEPFFGIVKSVLGFRQFSLRGHEEMSGEWCLVGGACKLKPMHTPTFTLAKAG